MTFDDPQTSRQLRFILESSHVNFFALDQSYRYTYFNRLHAETVLSIWGAKISVGTDMLHEVIREPQDRLKAKSNFDRALAGEEFVLREAYGDPALTRRFYEVRYSPARDESNQVVGVIVFVTDVSQLIRLDEEQLALEKKMQEAATLESLGLLAGGIAHDINNLLVPIILSTDLALRKLGADHPVAEKLLTVTEAARQAAELTKQLLAFSSDGWAAPILTDLNAVVAKASELAKVSVGRQTDLVITPTASTLPVYVDPVQIRQVLTNLLINASEASTERHAVVRIETSQLTVSGSIDADAIVPENVPHGDYAILAVKDTGRGMNADQLEHIFELFYSSKGKGRGFGLAATQAIVRKHRGFIAIDSTEGEGTLFRVGIPLMPADSGIVLPAAESTERAEITVQAEITEQAEITNQVAMPSGQLRILIADSDPRICSSLVQLCENSGHQVTAVDSASAALRVLNSAPPFSVFFVDEGLHDMSSLEIARQIAADNPTPIVKMSGFRQYDSGLTQEPRIRFLLSKPFTANDFNAMLRNFEPA